MKRNLLVNLAYCALLALVAIVNIIIAFVVGDDGDVFFFVFCAMIALILSNASQIRVVLRSNSDGEMNKLATLGMHIAEIIGLVLSLIIGILGIGMGLYTIGDKSADYPFASTEYQMMLIGFSIIISLLTIATLNRIDGVLPDKSTRSIRDYLGSYGQLTVFPSVIALCYLLSTFTRFFFIGALLVNAELIVNAIAFKQRSELADKHAKLNSVMAWIAIAVPAILALALGFGTGTFAADLDSLSGADKLGAILYSSMILYPLVSLVLFIAMYFLSNSLLSKKGKRMSMLSYALLPIVSIVIQILIFYFWYIGLVALVVAWGILTLLGLILEAFSTPVSVSGAASHSVPKAHKHMSDVEDAMNAVKATCPQIRAFRVVESGGDYAIEVYCSSADVHYITSCIRKSLNNEIKFHYL